jgi:hypothetical protein
MIIKISPIVKRKLRRAAPSFSPVTLRQGELVELVELDDVVRGISRFDCALIKKQAGAVRSRDVAQ